jgi:hypothetical protein
MGAAPPPPAPDDAGDSDDNVVLTVTMGADGTFTLYAGDEPEGGDAGDEGDVSSDDVAAMGSAGEGPAPQTAGSLGEAVKICADTLKAAQSGIGGGSAEANFASGFTGGAGAMGAPPMGGAPPGA